jgi:branched-chain amino acid transport system permease protein
MVAVAFGLPSYRVKGFYVAISTLTLQFISNWFFRTSAFKVIHGGKQQVLLNKADLLAGSFLSAVIWSFYCVALVVLLLIALLTSNTRRTAVGRTMLAVQQNNLSLAVLGIKLFQTRLVAMFLGGFMIGIAGGLYDFYLGFTD